MIAALVWKEYREHRAVWLALAVLGSVGLVIAADVIAPGGLAGATTDGAAALVGGALILAGMYGLVCGSMMFAGERESRGMTFLDIVPLSRLGLWWAKFLIGVAFTLLYCAVVIGVAAGRGFIGRDAIPAVTVVLLPLVALEAFAWGLCASTFCRTVLSAVALAALVPLPVIWLVSGMCLANAVHPQSERGLVPVMVVFHGLGMLLALGVSLGAFIDRDFEKRFVLKPTTSSYGSAAPKRQPRRWEVLLWLALRRGLILALVLAALGFVLGLGLPAVGAGLWPVATLFLGVACGAAVFFGEQAEGAFKFWGDQRLPAGWLWLRRSALWACIGAAVCGVMLVAAALHTIAQDRVLPDEPLAALERLLGVPPGAFGLMTPAAFLVVWPAYGFALGQLCALVWRKSAVAVVVALMTAAGVACAWLPSLFGGGLSVVPVLGVPLILLGACRLALWDWVTDRLRTRPAVWRLGGGVALASLWLTASQGFRVLEVPGGGQPFEVARMLAVLADPEQNRAGQQIRDVLREATDREKGPLAHPPWRADRAPDYREQVGLVVDHGWKVAPPPLAPWLDVVAADPWPARLGEVTAKPPGVYIDPRDVVSGRTDAADCRKGAELLTARALQVQAGGADDKALDDLMTVLALSRHLRHQAPGYAYLEGVEIERIGLAGLDHWLARPGRRPELLRRAQNELARHESATPPVTDALAAEYLRFRSTLGYGSRGGARRNDEVEAMLMQVPWEAERARRLGDAVFAGRLRLAESGAIVPPGDDDLLADWLPGPDGPSRGRLERLLAASWINGSVPVTAPLQRAAQMGLCRVRGARLVVALVLYQAEHGKTAPSLDALVPAVLPEVPEDPFSRQPLRYRVSQDKGERITWQRQLPDGGVEATRSVPAGQGVVWSVGPDGSDDGGTRQWTGGAKDAAGRDVIFLVPLVPAP